MIEIEKEKLKELLARAFEEGFCGYKDLKDDVIEVLVKEVEKKPLCEYEIPKKWSFGPNSGRPVTNNGAVGITNPFMGSFNNFIDSRDRNATQISGISFDNESMQSLWSNSRDWSLGFYPNTAVVTAGRALAGGAGGVSNAGNGNAGQVNITYADYISDSNNL